MKWCRFPTLFGTKRKNLRQVCRDFWCVAFCGFSFLPQNFLSPKAKQNKYCVVRHTKYQVYCSIFSRVTLSKQYWSSKFCTDLKTKMRKRIEILCVPAEFSEFLTWTLCDGKSREKSLQFMVLNRLKNSTSSNFYPSSPLTLYFMHGMEIRFHFERFSTIPGQTDGNLRFLFGFLSTARFSSNLFPAHQCSNVCAESASAYLSA